MDKISGAIPWVLGADVALSIFTLVYLSKEVNELKAKQKQTDEKIPALTQETDKCSKRIDELDGRVGKRMDGVMGSIREEFIKVRAETDEKIMVSVKKLSKKVDRELARVDRNLENIIRALHEKSIEVVSAPVQERSRMERRERSESEGSGDGDDDTAAIVKAVRMARGRK